jgi:hypothetical protein
MTAGGDHLPGRPTTMTTMTRPVSPSRDVWPGHRCRRNARAPVLLQEAQHYCEVLRSFEYYATDSFQVRPLTLGAGTPHALRRRRRRRRRWQALNLQEQRWRAIDPHVCASRRPSRQTAEPRSLILGFRAALQLKALTPGWEEKIVEVRKCIVANHAFVRAIADQRYVFENPKVVRARVFPSLVYTWRAFRRTTPLSLGPSTLARPPRTTCPSCARRFANGEGTASPLSALTRKPAQCARLELSRRKGARRVLRANPASASLRPPAAGLHSALPAQELERLYGNPKGRAEPVKVLVPGCGLGRLTWEIARRGECSTSTRVRSRR